MIYVILRGCFLLLVIYILANQNGLEEFLDNVCLHCHEFYSHTNSNMRASCRFNCFNNNTFKKCLKMFIPKK
uniref:Uncharacterized protein n=1 Tax=Rhabditophanes sp. KR3021 TaxID=114890 RepID=A0AC35U0L3_9BILA